MPVSVRQMCVATDARRSVNGSAATRGASYVTATSVPEIGFPFGRSLAPVQVRRIDEPRALRVAHGELAPS